MIAYKGFNKNIESVMGNGKKESCTFEAGKTYKEAVSKTARIGFHCCENPFDCLTYYSMDGRNRFFKVEASGDIDEDEDQKIACTQITLIEELTPLKYALEGLRYMIKHPQRERWQQSHGSVQVKEDECEAKEKGHIAIARGTDPVARGPEGSILGFIVEKNGAIQNAKLIVTPKEFADKWLRITAEREVEIIEES